MTPGAAGAHGADVVRASLTRRDRDITGFLFATLLLITVSVTLLILFTLVGQVIADAMPVFSDRGTKFLTDTIGSNPTKVGIGPGI
jgi:ABC-type phosphate transport system permease subunit